MSREIKFRAWDGDKMHSQYVVAGMEFCNPISVLQDEPYAKMMYGVKEWKLMQFTGLKDKNGKEIYEGDIVEHYDFEDGSNKLRVGWHHGTYNMVAYYGSGGNDYITMEEIEHEHEVIGNIYENPDLLTTQSDETD